MTQDRHDPRLPIGRTVIHDRLTLADGTKVLVPREEAQALIREGLARPEGAHTPPALVISEVGT